MEDLSKTHFYSISNEKSVVAQPLLSQQRVLAHPLPDRLNWNFDLMQVQKSEPKQRSLELEL